MLPTGVKETKCKSRDDQIAKEVAFLSDFSFVHSLVSFNRRNDNIERTDNKIIALRTDSEHRAKVIQLDDRAPRFGLKNKVQRKKNQRTHRRKLKVKREKHGGIIVGDIANPELITGHMLSKRRTSPRANVTLSGKKKRKLIKQLKHMAAEKEREQEAAQDTEMAQAPKEKKTLMKSTSEGGEVEVEIGEEAMEDDDEQWEDEGEEEEVVG